MTTVRSQTLFVLWFASACSSSVVIDAGLADGAEDGAAPDAAPISDAAVDLGMDAGPIRWARDIVAGDEFTCVLALDGTVWCFGRGLEGELGDGTQSETSMPHRALGLANVVVLTAGRTHACAVDALGAVYCWGDAADGRTGTGEHDTPVVVPTRVAGIDDAVDVRAGQWDTCAVHRTGLVSCWGLNRSGQVGVAPPASCASGPVCPSVDTPVTVAGITDATAVWFTRTGTCARHAAGGAACWGGTAPFMPPTADPTHADVTDAQLGWGHECVLRASGAVACAGMNGQEELGAPGPTTTTLADLPGVSGVTHISVHGGATCAVHADGALDCWGDNDDGRLGTGDTSTTLAPMRRQRRRVADR